MDWDHPGRPGWVCWCWLWLCFILLEPASSTRNTRSLSKQSACLPMRSRSSAASTWPPSSCALAATPITWAGEVYFDVPGMLSIPTPNLTSGAGGVGATFQDEDCVRAIRHGVGPDGRALVYYAVEGFPFYERRRPGRGDRLSQERAAGG